jgi:hypothetical protein
MSETRTCRACGRTFPLDRFPMASRRVPGRQPKYRATCRICYRAQCREVMARTRARRAAARYAVDRERPVMLPIGPFRDWLEQQIALRQDAEAFAAEIGIDSRTVWRWRHEAAEVTADMVDRCVCHALQPWLLREMYPDWYEAAA